MPGIYVNDVMVDWQPGFLIARSKALEIIDFLENRGFQVRAPGLRNEPSVKSAEVIKVRCQQCGHLNDEDAKFCQGCGTALKRDQL